MPLHQLLSAASRVAGGLPLPGQVRHLVGGERRRKWVGDGRAHIEVRGVRRPGTEHIAIRLEEALTELADVTGAEVNGLLGRVAIRYDAAGVTVDDLIRVIEEIETFFGVDDDPLPSQEVEHPGDLEPVVREAVTAASNLVGAGLSMLGRIRQTRPLHPAVPAALSMADHSPRIRAELEKRLGRSATDLAFTVGNAVAQTLAQGPVSLLVEAGHRGLLVGEARARRRAWGAWEEALAEHDASHRCEPLAVPARPTPVPPGPVERYADRAVAAALAGSVAGLAITKDTQRAAAFLQAGVPRAARMGREAFSVQLSRLCSGRGVLVLNGRALRRLDRVDTVVLDRSALLTGRRMVADIIPATGPVDIAELHQQAHELVDLDRPTTQRERGDWAVAPLSRYAGHVATEVRTQARKQTRQGATVLALSRGAELVALVSVVPELDPLAEALAAAGPEGSVLLAGAGSGLRQRLQVGRTVSGGNRLAASVRSLQEAGHVVLLVSATGHEALAAADIGVGVTHSGRPLPWSADVVCSPGLAGAHLLVSAVPAAHGVSKRSAQLAFAGSAGGVLLGGIGLPGSAVRRASTAVQLASVGGMALGTWSALSLSVRPHPVPTDSTPWHALSTETVLERLGSHPDGLDEEEAHRRRPSARDMGQQPEAERLARASLEELANPLTPVLATGAGLAAAVGSMLDGVMITGVLGVNAVIGGAQRLGADRALARLADSVAVQVLLRRSGATVGATADGLVAGDVVELEAGDVVPADCRVLSAAGLEVDESSLTGESLPVAKTADPTAAEAVADRSSMLYADTVVAAGRGVAVVVATGLSTEIGRTAQLGHDSTRVTGVEARLRALTKLTLPMSVVAGGILLASNLARGRSLAQALGPAVGLAVAAVPEGLPFVATVAQLAAARRLSKRGALVRNPSTIETLGRVDVLCFDKTGTLTQGKIALGRVSDGAMDAPVDALTPHLRHIVAAGLRASPEQNGQPLAHPTDRAVVSGAVDLAITPEEGLEFWERVDEMHFEPGRGYHAVLGHCTHGHRLSVKGAPEVVLARCDTWLRDSGAEVPLDAAAREQVDEEVDRLARQGYRVLVIAERAASSRRDLDESRIRGLRLLGVLALADPVRPTAAAAVARLQQAGVEIVMVTGDHPTTAEAIAAELNALNGRRIMTGPELAALSDEELAKHLPDVAVFARVSPAQKARIVAGLQQAGRTVSVTGDGANDAPAIRLADVGVALGEGATSAAREAADLVVTDDQIETIIDAIVEGRVMWASVRDAVAILLGGNLGEIAFTLGTGLVTGTDVLNARQLLLVNLLTDVLPAMAVAVRPPSGITPETLLAEGPDASLGTALNQDVYLRAATTAGAALAAWVLGRMTGRQATAGTIALLALVGAQLGQTVAVAQRNPLVIVAAVASLGALGAIIQVPGLSHFFGSRPLGPRGWAIGLGAAFAATVVSVLLASRARRAVAALPA